MTYPAGWRRCQCGDFVLQGHLTCGRVECSESDARERARRVSKGDIDTIVQIARRALDILSVPEDERMLAMPAFGLVIAMVHVDAIALDLDRMLTCADEDLIHDLIGMKNHWDMNTRRMRDGFVPRCARSIQ